MFYLGYYIQFVIFHVLLCSFSLCACGHIHSSYSLHTRIIQLACTLTCRIFFCRFSVRARHLGKRPLLELLPSPLRLPLYLSFYAIVILIYKSQDVFKFNVLLKLRTLADKISRSIFEKLKSTARCLRVYLHKSPSQLYKYNFCQIFL